MGLSLLHKCVKSKISTGYKKEICTFQLARIRDYLMVRWWPEPTAGDIVWCHFPDNINPRPKPRPALILVVFDDDAPEFTVQVAYGTSQRTTKLYRGEFAILRDKTWRPMKKPI